MLSKNPQYISIFFYCAHFAIHYNTAELNARVQSTFYFETLRSSVGQSPRADSIFFLGDDRREKMSLPGQNEAEIEEHNECP